jgi:C-terminal processing protease CtpA/Prc
MKLKLFALILGIAGLPSAAAQDATEAQQAAAADAAMAQVLQEAETARVEAQRARREAERVVERAREAARAQRELERAERERASARSGEIARERAVREEEMEQAREELSRAHRELRSAQREVALAHRELARSGPSLQAIRLPALGDRPVIGVVLGDETGDGVELIGVSPDGPAEAAGLEVGDVMVAINGRSLGAEDAKPEIFAVMETAKPGDPIEIAVLRAGDRLDFTVVAERREPASWQSLVRIPEITTVERIEGGPGERRIVIESTVVPEIDEQALAERMELLERKLADTEIYFHGDGAPHLAGDYEFHVEGFSDIAGHAFDSANIWFGLPQAQGLQFATVNEGLGAYFKTDRGVLVLEAKDGNAYGLEAGDVILEVGGTPVDTPSELMRVLRELEPGDEIELAIKRDRRDRTLNAVMPENRFGLR